MMNFSTINITDRWLVGSNSTSDFGLYEQPVLRDVRVTVLWILEVLGALGNGSVLVWLWCHRKRRSRILRLILNLVVSDTLVVACATSPQLAWEYADRGWRGGDALCRLFKFFQTFSICASNYLIVAIAVDRHRAIRRPLAVTGKVCFLGGCSWLVAAVVNSPILVLFKETEHHGQTVCRNVLYDAPHLSLRVYLTTVVVLVFIIPLIAISVCYLQIFRKIAQKADEIQPSTTIFTNYATSSRCKKSVLQRNTTSTYLPKAKVKTLRMTLVIITSFLACSAPYCIVEMWRVYGDYQSLGATTYSILAALAVSNSSTNPFVFLAFHLGNGSRSRQKNRRRTMAGGNSQGSSLYHQYCCCCKCCSVAAKKDLEARCEADLKETLSTETTSQRYKIRLAMKHHNGIERVRDLDRVSKYL